MFVKKSGKNYEPVQLSLFDQEPTIEKIEECDEDSSAFIYIGTMHSSGRILYKATVRDAKIICSQSETKGVGMGGEWALFWTTEKNFLSNGGTLENMEKGRCQKDDGRFDKLLASMSITAIPI